MLFKCVEFDEFWTYGNTHDTITTTKVMDRSRPPKVPLCPLFLLLIFCSKIYSLNKLQNAQYHAVNFRHYVTVNLQSLSVYLNLRVLCTATFYFPNTLQPLATTIVISALISLTIVNTADKWNHVIFCLSLSDLFNLVKVHPQGFHNAASVRISC